MTREQLALEWNYEKNKGLTLSDMSLGSTRKVWWTCPEGHDYECDMYHRVARNHGCPYCSGHRVLQGFNDLLFNYPDIAKEWDYDKNDHLKNGFGQDISSPEKVTYGSSRKVWWQCPCGHSYQQSVAQRVQSKAGCPICNQQKRTSFPEQALYFYVSKYYPDAINSDIKAIGMELDIYIPSKRIAIEYDGAFWHGVLAHKAKTETKKNMLCQQSDIQMIRVREYGLEQSDGCICISRTDSSSSASLNDTICAVLQATGISSPQNIDVDADSLEIYNSYVRGRAKRSLSYVRPDVAKLWDFSKNGDLTPQNVTASSCVIVWWRCPSGHEWQQRIKTLAETKHGCPYCSGRYPVVGQTDLASQCPEIAKEWNYAKNFGLMDNYGRDVSTPDRVMRYSGLSVWWTCSQCGHDYSCKIRHRNEDRNTCPYCNNPVVLGKNDLLSQYPLIASEWDYDKNVNLTDMRGRDISAPAKISIQSSVSVWWKCSQCGHEWQSAVATRTGAARRKTKGHFGCPECARRANCKQVCCLDTGVTYDRTVDAAKTVGLKDSSGIVSACRDIVRVSGGYHWRYVDEYCKGTDCSACKYRILVKTSSRLMKVRCVETGVVYLSLKEASALTGINKGCIWNCCTGKQLTAGGYHWEYAYNQNVS